jgi:hypothetical protein
VTSTVVFQSPTGNPYILCTTSHSSERRKKEHEGEFPFLAPAVMPFPKIQNGFFHPLTQFVHQPALQAAAVPIHGNLVALLDRVGQIWLLSLERSEQSVLKTSENKIKMALKLAPDLSGKAGSLRFSPDGSKLFAADNRGNLVTFCFSDQGFPVRKASAAESKMFPVELPALEAVFELDGSDVSVGF